MEYQDTEFCKLFGSTMLPQKRYVGLRLKSLFSWFTSVAPPGKNKNVNIPGKTLWSGAPPIQTTTVKQGLGKFFTFFFLLLEKKTLMINTQYKNARLRG